MKKYNYILSNYPWVFWFKISYKPKWFSRLWSTRGANYFEMQLGFLRISIGRPWLKNVTDAYIRDQGSCKRVHETNKQNLQDFFSFKMKSPIKL